MVAIKIFWKNTGIFPFPPQVDAGNGRRLRRAKQPIAWVPWVLGSAR